MITKKEKQEVWELYKKDTPISKISKITKISRPSIYNILDEEQQQEEKQERKKEIMPNKTAKIFQLFREGKTNNEILAIAGVEPERVIGLREAFDINLKQERQVKEQKEKFINKVLTQFKIDNDMLTNEEREYIKQQNHKKELINQCLLQDNFETAQRISLIPAETLYNDFLEFRGK